MKLKLFISAAVLACVSCASFLCGRSAALSRIPDTTDLELSARDYKYRTYEASELLINMLLSAAKDDVSLPRYTWADFAQHEAQRFIPEEKPGSRLRGALTPSNQTMLQHRKHLRAAPRPSTDNNGAQDNGRRPG